MRTKTASSLPHTPWITRLPLIALPIALLVIWTVAYAVLHIQRQELLQVLGKEQQAALRVLAGNVESELQLYRSAMGAAAALVPIEDLDRPERLRAFIASQRPLRAVFDDALVLSSPQGRILASDPAIHEGLDVSGRHYFQAAVASENAVLGEAFVTTRTHDPVVPVSVAVRDAQGRVRAVLAGGVNLARHNVLARLGEFRIGRTGYFFLLTADGMVLSHPRAAVTSRLPELAALSSQGSGLTAADSTLYSLHRFNGDRWILGVGFPEAEALAPVRELRGQVLAIAFGVSLLAVFLAASAYRGTRQLQRSEARYRSLSRLSSDWYWECDAELRLSTIRGGGGLDRYLGARIEDLPLLPGQGRTLAEYERHVRAHEPFYRLELGLREPDGNPLYLSVSGEPVWRGRRFRGYRGAATDVTSQKLAEQAVREANQVLELRVEERTQALAESRQRLSMAVQAGGVGLWDWDLERDEVRLHDRPDEPPRSMAEVVARVHPEDRAQVERRLQRYLAQPKGIYENEYRYRRSDGEYSWALTRGRVLLWSEDGRPLRMTGAIQDITERKRSEQRIEYLAHYDALTGLPNRVLFHDRVRQTLHAARRSGESFALLFIDLDQFKHVNDALGHQVGDDLLRAAARRLRGELRDADTLSRQGGDEFLVLVPGLKQAEDAGVVAAKLLEGLREPMAVAGHELQISGSLGIAVYPGDGDDVDTLIKNADLAMYQSKSAGRNSYHFFTRSMDERVAELMTISNDLRQALEQQQLYLVYQPQVSATTGAITGAEALLRWDHPTRGPIGPATFIPVAEDTGQILALGEWVLRAAVEQLRRWGEEGLDDLCVSVNLSALQFRQTNLAEYVERLLNSAAVSARRLELEITESALVEEAEATLAALHGMGCQLAVDDFGTGYSNLRYLKRFSIDKLKIDQCFVRDVPGDTEDEAVVEAIIGLARSLDMLVLAEGVETAAQLDFLRARDCDQVQGYYFSRPLRVEAFEELLRGDRHLVGADVAPG